MTKQELQDEVERLHSMLEAVQAIIAELNERIEKRNILLLNAHSEIERLRGIVEQQRERILQLEGEPDDHQSMVIYYQGEEIQALQKENNRLRGALEYIATFEHVSLKSCDINVKELGEVARQALEGDQ